MVELHTSLIDGSLSRRDFVRRAAVLGMAFPALGTLLAACGGEDEGEGDAADPTATGAGGAPEATSTQQISVQVPTPTPMTAATAGATAAASPEATTATEPAAGAGTRGGSVNFLREGDADLYDPVLN
ncbi:MAG: hypothetical protein M3439_07505, partial [Chloroflexota bacterium]|nr:hypothetical protein [Chloroflexota bacterium]